ncbi:hypothetical protein [Mycobacterium sp. ENV421]|uniref:hypothetical protein n=1 Tax=Mycobacterium sp. ENV421 TaxID=1213407 RepID=UPI001158089E|nr:hypothetical protein [Mycobacterium sp. ENV421]
MTKPVAQQPNWSMVPAPLRVAIEASHPTNGEPSTEHLALIEAAIKAVAHKESRAAPRAPHKPAKPVQLALFELEPLP